MIRNIIFDFGNIFISLNTNSFKRKLALMGLISIPKELYSILHQYERGEILDDDFLGSIQQHTWYGSKDKIKKTWESLIGEFPQEKLDFLQKIKQEYRIFLLSNINSIHEKHIQQKLGESFYHKFLHSFERTYYSHHIGLRKPEKECFEFVLNENKLIPEQTLFVDDTLENIEQAKRMKIKTWHLNPKQDSVTNLNEWLKLTEFYNSV